MSCGFTGQTAKQRCEEALILECYFSSVIFLWGHFSVPVAQAASQTVIITQLKEQQAVVESYKKAPTTGEKNLPGAT